MHCTSAGCWRNQFRNPDCSNECCCVEEQSGDGGKDWPFPRARLSSSLCGRNGLRTAPSDEC